MVTPISPVSVDHLEIYVLVDNYVDGGLSESAGVTRYRLGRDGKLPVNSFLAEHAICLILTAVVESKCHRLILDAGCSPVALPHNLEFEEVNVSAIFRFWVNHNMWDSP